MHELAITESVVASIRDRVGDRPVTRVRLQIGRLSGVVVDSVRFSFELVTEDTNLAGAVLDIDEPVGRAHCRTCGAETDALSPLAVCPCGSLDVTITGGQDLRILSVEVRDRV